MTIKLTEEQEKKYGVKTQEELIALLDKKSEPAPTAPAAAPAAASTTPPAATQNISTTHLEGLRTDFTAAIGALKTEMTDAIGKVVETAKAAASTVVSSAIAKSGGQAIAQKGAATDTPPAGGPAVDPNDFGAQYDSTPAIRDEFISKSSYIKYREALKAGRIRIHQESSEQRN